MSEGLKQRRRPQKPADESKDPEENNRHSDQEADEGDSKETRLTLMEEVLPLDPPEPAPPLSSPEESC